MTTDNGAQGGDASGSDALAQAQAEIQRLTELVEKENTRNNSLAESYKNITLGLLSPEARKMTEQVLEKLDKGSELDQRETALEAKARDVKALELLYGPDEYLKYGVTKEQLLKAETPDAMEAIALRAKAEYLEKNGSTRPNSAAIPSDKGGGSGGAEAKQPIEGKGRDAVAAVILNDLKRRAGVS